MGRLVHFGLRGRPTTACHRYLTELYPIFFQREQDSILDYLHEVRLQLFMIVFASL